VLTALSGVLVSVETWFEFYDKSVLFQWMTPGSMVVGTIGNSNYLGAYLLFPCSGFHSALLSPQRKAQVSCRRLVDLRVCCSPLFKSQGGVGRYRCRPSPLYPLCYGDLSILPVAYVRSRAKQAAIIGVSFVVLLAFLWALAPQRFHVMMGYKNVTNPTSFILRTQKYFQASWCLSRRTRFSGRDSGPTGTRLRRSGGTREGEGRFFQRLRGAEAQKGSQRISRNPQRWRILAAIVLLLFVSVVLKHALQ